MKRSTIRWKLRCEPLDKEDHGARSTLGGVESSDRLRKRANPVKLGNLLAWRLCSSVHIDAKRAGMLGISTRRLFVRALPLREREREREREKVVVVVSSHSAAAVGRSPSETVFLWFLLFRFFTRVGFGFRRTERPVKVAPPKIPPGILETPPEDARRCSALQGFLAWRRLDGGVADPPDRP